MRSADLFQVVMIPSRVLLTMASSELSTMAASRAVLRSARLRSVISRATLEAPMTWPEESLTGEMVREMSTREPSLRWRTVSK